MVSRIPVPKKTHSIRGPNRNPIPDTRKLFRPSKNPFLRFPLSFRFLDCSALGHAGSSANTAQRNGAFFPLSGIRRQIKKQCLHTVDLSGCPPASRLAELGEDLSVFLILAFHVMYYKPHCRISQAFLLKIKYSRSFYQSLLHNLWRIYGLDLSILRITSFNLSSYFTFSFGFRYISAQKGRCRTAPAFCLRFAQDSSGAEAPPRVV